MALAAALYRNGVLSVADVEGMVESITRKAAAATGEEAEQVEMAAHLANCVVLEVETEGLEAEWQAEQARSRFRVIEGGEG